MVLKLEYTKNHLRGFSNRPKFLEAQVHSLKVDSTGQGLGWTWMFDSERFRDDLYSNKIKSGTLHPHPGHCFAGQLEIQENRLLALPPKLRFPCF